MVIVRAPVRISFGGGGTDLAAYYIPFGGFVVSAAITRYCYVVADRSPDGGIHINSADYRVYVAYPRGEIPAVDGPLALAKAAITYFASHGLLETGVNHMTIGAIEAADLACWLEIEHLDLPIGKQDQYASACGGLNAIEFTANGVSVTPLDLPAEVVTALSTRLLLFSTGKTHDSACILRQQQADTQTNPRTIESLHRIKALAGKVREALIAEDLDCFGQLLDLSWREKRSLSKMISTEAIDHYYNAARKAGALGGKVVGAGGGGFLLFYCAAHRRKAVRETMTRIGLREITFDFDFAGALVLAIHEPEIYVEHQIRQ
jgi:D-glycero-alpha-D-manno-heptose-7-phosphate kinase